MFFHFLFLFLIGAFCALGCGQKPRQVTSPPKPAPTKPSPPRTHTKGPVYVFKYTGRIACYDNYRSLKEMEQDLINLGIPVHNRYTAEDGKEYSSECYSKTADINVYVIDSSHLSLSETKGGFCECTPKPKAQETTCVPYKYETQPECK